MEEEPTAERSLERVTDAWGVLLEGPDEPKLAKRTKTRDEERKPVVASPDDADPEGEAPA